MTQRPDTAVPLVLTEREMHTILSWWSLAYGEDATSPEDDELASRLAESSGLRLEGGIVW